MLAFVGVAGPLPALEVPFLSGRVTDLAGLIGAERAVRLEARLRAAEEKTGAQVVVLTIVSLEGEALEEYSHRVASTWKLGRAERDDGVLFLVARDDRKMRIEVGRGLEPELTDVECGRILDSLARPAFRAADFGGGIEAAVDAILGQIDGTGTVPDTVVSPPPAVPVLAVLALLFLLTVGLFSVFALFGPNGIAWLLYFFLMPFYLAFPSALSARLGVALWGLWTIGFPLLRLALRHTRRGRAWTDRTPWASSLSTQWQSSGSANSWSGSTGSSSSGFSGGGGDFGGGGASSSW